MRRTAGFRGRLRWKTGIAGVLTFGLTLVGLLDSAGAQDAKAEALLAKVIGAHGGMQAWENLKDLTFTITRVALDAQGEVAGAGVSLYQMKRDGKIRVETVTGKGLLVQGFDGQRPWATLGGKPDTAPEALKRAHNQSVNWWYWMGIPFKLRDPGVILRHRGTLEFRGKAVEILDVTFEPGVGVTNDRYSYSIDPQTYQIVFVELQLQAGVWPGVGGPTPSRSAWLDYRKEGPFTLHTKRIFYANPELTAKRAMIVFGDFQFNTGVPDRLFTAP